MVRSDRAVLVGMTVSALSTGDPGLAKGANPEADSVRTVVSNGPPAPPAFPGRAVPRPSPPENP